MRFDVLIEDSTTGERRWASSYFDVGFDAFWWTDGNGSCDCNRELVFDASQEPTGRCSLGRYYIVDTRGDAEGYSLADFNNGYPAREEGR